MSDGGLDDFDFELPSHCIAQAPPARRDEARLLVWHRDGALEDAGVESLVRRVNPGDVLVLNDTRVLAARLRGRKSRGSAAVEILLLRPIESPREWLALVRPGRRLPPGTSVDLEGEICVVVQEAHDGGARRVVFPAGVDVPGHAERHGSVPLPPYIDRAADENDRHRYQTVYARHDGSVAAPTAGLHWTEEMLTQVRGRGAEIVTVTLHVGLGTFKPLEDADLQSGFLHAESFRVPAETIDKLRRARAGGGRAIVVGTTTCRALESLRVDAEGDQTGETRLMIRPGHRFHWTDVLITNFHLPRSSLLLLVSALAGDTWRRAYAHAVESGYRFYSYGDANWIEAAAESAT